jgi:hypothetical protein
MDIMDVFRGDAFTAQSLSAAVDKQPFVPNLLGSLNIFEPLPIRTTALAVEEREGTLSLIPTTSRGAPSQSERTTERRKVRYFEAPRLFAADTIYAHELQNIREFVDNTGQVQTVLKQLQTEVAYRLSGPSGLQSRIEYTWEHHRLGALRGVLLDSNNSTELFDWFDEFEITQSSTVYFNLEGTGSNIAGKCNDVIRGMARAAGGAFTMRTQVHALCGDDFYDALVEHPDVVESYTRWINAGRPPATTPVDGGVGLGLGGAFSAFAWGGIVWHNYRGSDDGTTIAVTADKAHFFPVNAPGIFKVAFAPGESFDQINRPGQPVYVMPILDKDRNEWFRLEVKSFPLHICTRPAVLYTGDLDAS